MSVAANRLRWLSAAGILASGAAWSAILLSHPVREVGVNTATLRALAERLQTTPGEPATAAIVFPAAQTTPVSARTYESREALPKRTAAVAPARATAVVPITSVRHQRSTTAPSASDPLKSIALAGLTREGNTQRAWLVQLDTLDREEVGVGEPVFGFRLKEIGDDSVLLSRNSHNYELRLGEKSIPPDQVQTAALETPAAAPATPQNFGGAPGGFGFGGRRGGFRGFGAGGFGQLGRMTLGSGRQAAAASPTGGNRQSRRTNSNRTTASGAFGGGLPFGGLGLGRGSAANGATSVFASGSVSTTSNPQTARRAGVSLQDATEAMKPPAAITNPQTQRRTGTSTPGFGDASANGGVTNTNRGITGSNRTGTGTTSTSQR